ncbi:MAG TPA: zinc ABC transporter substrate-binding protein [Patescibacteria group bacterium]|nr:zinc ABC transporter substrate-binding protein [Patescibacteria group bacterium]
MQNNKKIILIIAVIAVLGGVVYTVLKSDKQEANPEAGRPKLKVVTSIYPLEEFAKNIGKDYVDIVTITPVGTEPHEYEPTPRDLVALYDTQVFVFNGNGVDAWAEKAVQDLSAKGIEVLNVSRYVDSLKSNDPEEVAEGNDLDPHFWLDPVLAAKEADLIADTLIRADQVHASEYLKNRDAFKAKLTELDHKFKNGLAQCKEDFVVTSHNAFNYLANRYGFRTLYVLGLSPEEEPSPKTVSEIAKAAKEKGIKYIFFESLVSPKLSETIANEIGAQTLELNPIEGLTSKELAAGESYFTKMENNLKNLQTAMQCN